MTPTTMKEIIPNSRVTLSEGTNAVFLGYQDNPEFGFFREANNPDTFFSFRITGIVSMTHDLYNTTNFPHPIAISGPWTIYRNAEGWCAAIPTDPNSGHLASSYGDLHHVERMLADGTIKPYAFTVSVDVINPKADSIYSRLEFKLGRTPTRQEIHDEIKRIISCPKN